MRPSEVLDALGDFRQRLDNPEFMRYIASVAAVRRADPRLIEITHGAFEHMIIGMQCFQVTKNMAPLVQVAAECFSNEDTFRFDHAPTPRGLVQFETPLLFPDIRGELLGISWLFWDVTQPMPVAVAFLDRSHTDSGSERFKEEIAGHPVDQAIGKWFWSSVQVLDDGRVLSVLTEEQRRSYAEELPLDDYLHLLRSDVEYVKAREDRAMKKAGVGHDSTLPRVLKALWILMAQRAGQVTTYGVDRAATKRAKRLHLPTEVTVIELRAPEVSHDQHHESEHRDWRFRWMVRGHFAWRHCSEHHPLAEPYEKGWRCRVYLHPYAKNADDVTKPWKMGEKVYQLKR